jgi:hypothetical protein
MLFLCRIHREISRKISTSTELSDILHTDSENLLVLSPTVASHYYNCRTDGSISPGNDGYLLVYHAPWEHLDNVLHKSIPSVQPTKHSKKWYCFIDFNTHAYQRPSCPCHMLQLQGEEGSRSRSHITTDSQSANRGVKRPFGICDQFYFLLDIFLRQLRVYNFVTPSLTRGRVCDLLYNCFLALPEQSLLGRSPAELTARFQYLYPPGTGCPSYNPGHWVPFLSPLTTRRAAVEVF